jgi:hypothetical protein
MRPNDIHGRIPGGGNICRSRSWPSPDRLLLPRGRGLFHLQSACEGYETIPPHDADPKHPRNMLCSRTVVPRQRGRQDSRDIGHPRIVGDAPFHHRVRIEFRPEPRLNLRTGVIGQLKNASPARPAQRRNTPICGNGSLARYKVIHAALRMTANRRFR